MDLPTDHPGFHDPVYRARRDEIAALARAHHAGQAIPQVAYSVAENALWRVVAVELIEAYERDAVGDFRAGVAALDLPLEQLPQLAEVSERLAPLTGFSFEPVPGLLETREFWSFLAQRRFPSTQYLRHPSVPRYTPEPDVIHELLGHANALAVPRYADLYVGFAETASRLETGDALAFLGQIFWFTMEFGVAWERGELRAYGAGLLSSVGELHAFRGAEIRPADFAVMGTLAYDITTYQPVLFAMSSMDELSANLVDLFTSFDDETPGRLSHRAQATHLAT